MKIILNNNRGKSWVGLEESFIKGFAFYNGKLLEEESLGSTLLYALKSNTISETLSELNGNFSAIIKNDTETYLISDKMKSYPLLYLKIDGEWIVSDQAKTILDLLPSLEKDESSIITYLALGYLHGSQTFIQDCKIVSSGTYVILNSTSESVSYHTHIYPKIQIDVDSLLDECERNLEAAVLRMLETIGDRPVWIPLSGGYDSRLLACVLKKLNVQNIQCYTYGVKGSYEVSISKRVAEKLCLPWHYVEYNLETERENLGSSTETDYIFWGMNLNTTSHYQDFIAFKELRKRDLITDDAIIIPGHSGEILGRDQVPYHLLNSRKSVADLIYLKYFHWNKLKNKYKRIAMEKIGPSLNSVKASDDAGYTVDLFTNWNVQNRQSNFILNSVRVYEYFGVDWRAPLWDDEVSKFWFSLDYQTNSKTELYNRFMFDKYFIPMGVDIYKKALKSRSLLSRIKLPFDIKTKLKRKLLYFSYFKSTYDPNGFHYRNNFYLTYLKNYSTSYIKYKRAYTNSLIALYQVSLIDNYFLEKKKI